MKSLIALPLLLFLLTFCACGGESCNHSELAYYDQSENIYRIPAKALSYRLPSPATSIVADPESLPEQLSMCVIDTATNAGVFLFNLAEWPKTKDDAESAVKQIAQQNNTDYDVAMDYDLAVCKYMNSPAWRFNVDLTMCGTDDTLAITYRGYMFGTLALVVSAETATLTDDIFHQYISGLNPDQ